MDDTYSAMSHEELADYAKFYGANDDGTVPFSEISWAYDSAFDVSRLHAIMSPAEWRDWMDDEIAISVEDLEDPERWAPLIDEDIRDPVVIFEHPDGNLHIWDGWHRSAATVIKGADTMKVVFGTAPGYTPKP
jgi:hypothetical protein